MAQKTKVMEKEGYQISVVGRHVQVTDAMKDYAVEKVSKIERFSNQIIETIITMDIVKLEHKVDVVLKVGHTKIKVSASSDNMYASIDKAADRLQAKLLKYRSRLTEHHGKHLSVVDMNVQVLEAGDELTAEVNEQIEDENRRRLEALYKPHAIVARETMPLKTLTPKEAIMKLELSDDVFLLFRNEADLKLKVLYKRKDGHYGVMEPE